MENSKENYGSEPVISGKNSRANKILFAVVGLAIILSVGATYWRTMVKKDYIISSQVDCDPATEKCFIWKCNTALMEGGEGACTGNEDEDIWYYKNAQRKAYNIPLCDPEKDENCLPFQCNEGEKDCQETLCDETNVPEGESCNNPEEYVKNNPEEEDVDADSEEGSEE